MYSIKTHYWLIPVMLIMTSPGMGQERFSVLWESQAALNYQALPNYAHNFSVSSRSIIFQDENLALVLRQFDIAHFSDLKISDKQSLGLGLQYRIGQAFKPLSEDEFRITEQYNIVHGGNAIRMGHRLRAEQRIRPSGTAYRFRYRFALDGPLKGEKLNVGEPYFVSSLEGLYSIAAGRQPQIDQRLEVVIGWLLQSGLKIELGLEYRLEEVNIATEHLVFINSAVIVSL